MSKTLFIGSCTVDIMIPTPFIPKSSEDVNTKEHTFALGGCAYNVSEVSRLLNVPYLHAFSLGTGIYGDFVRKKLLENNIPVFRESDKQHGACICLVEESGQRSFIAYHGVEYQFDRSWFKDIDTKQFDSVYICGLELEDAGDEIVSFLEENSFNNIYFAPGPRLLSIRKDLLERIFDLRPIIHLNDQEIKEFTKEDNIRDAVLKLNKLNNNDVIVTLGKDGSLLYSDNEFVICPVKETKPVDTTGAGDCHLGTYIAYRAKGLDKKDCLYKANLFASEVIMHLGPNLKEEYIKELL